MVALLTGGVRLGVAMLLGVPAGFIAYIVQQALEHPALGWMLRHHPLISVPTLLGGGVIAGLVRLSGIALLRSSLVLQAWIVGAACVIYLLADKPAKAPAR